MDKTLVTFLEHRFPYKKGDKVSLRNEVVEKLVKSKAVEVVGEVSENKSMENKAVETKKPKNKQVEEVNEEEIEDVIEGEIEEEIEDVIETKKDDGNPFE